jgi:excisionase family DNA binding protein
MTINLENIQSKYCGGEPYVSAAEVAKHLNLNTWSVYKLSQRKKIRSHKFGKALRFKLSEVEEDATRATNCTSLVSLGQ